jgi:hypothetical protein
VTATAERAIAVEQTVVGDSAFLGQRRWLTA